MAFGRKKRDDPKVDLTPMVDVVFLLLIFFMISTTFVETPGLSIKLPESTSSIVEKEPEEIRIYLSRDGEIFLKDEPISLGALASRLEGFGAKAKNMTFLLLADEKALHGKVVQLMDLAKAAGFGKLAIATEQRKKP